MNAIKKLVIGLCLCSAIPSVWGVFEDHDPHQLLVRWKMSTPIPGRMVMASEKNILPAGINSLLTSIPWTRLRPLIGTNAVVKPAQTLKAQEEFNTAQDIISRTYVLELNESESLDDVKGKIQANPLVESVSYDHRLRAVDVPNDPMFTDQWALNNSGQSGGRTGFDTASHGTVGRDIDAELAWKTQTGSTNVIVAIIDFGVNWSHPDLLANIWTNPADGSHGWDFGDNDNNPDDTCTNSSPDLNARGHGTHVAGIVGAVGNNGVGVSGVNWNVTLMPLKGADSQCNFDESAAVSAMQFAQQHGARILNLSWGADTLDSSMQAAINSAIAQGIVVVAAAGNDGVSTPFYPAAFPNVISVAATDRTDKKVSFSNYGSWITMAAPGVAIKSTVPSSLGSYIFEDGTSMASPMVAGVAALVLAEYPSITSTDIKSRLISSCENIDSVNPSFVGLIGAGRVNAVRALMSVTAVSPATGSADSLLTLDVTGISFDPAVAVQLKKSGYAPIAASQVTVQSPTTLQCLFDLSGAASGAWDISVSIGQTERLLSGAFSISSGSTPVNSTYPLIVVGGTGSGNYLAGEVVNIAANSAPTGQIFNNWTGASVLVATNSITSLIMPAISTSVTATYSLAPPNSLDNAVAFPNPHRGGQGSASIRFKLVPSGTRLQIFDITGGQLYDQTDITGAGYIDWPVGNQSGSKVGSGVYLYRLTAPSGQQKKGRVVVIQ